MTDIELATRLAQRGIPTWATKLRPTDIINLHLRLKRNNDRRVLHLERVTVPEAGTRIVEAVREGWTLA